MLELSRLNLPQKEVPAFLPKSHSRFCSNPSIHLETINIYEHCGLVLAAPFYPLEFGALRVPQSE